MKKLKRLLAVILVINMISGLVPGLWHNVLAAPSVNIAVMDFSEGTLKIKWDLLKSRGNTVVTYHSPDSAANSVTVAPDDPNPNTVSISGLGDDYIYDMNVKVMDSTNTKVIGEDTLYFLAGISFYSKSVDQQSVSVTGGGKESGVIPTLKVSWIVPKVFDGTTIVDVNDAPARINSALERVNFLIKIEDNIERSNVLINYDSINKTYCAATETSGGQVSGDTARVNYDSATGQWYFYLLGRKDDGAHLAVRSEIDANKYADSAGGGKVLPDILVNESDPAKDEREFVLPHDGIFPGTVYSMKIVARPEDDQNQYIDAVYMGMSESSLLGSFPYVYTPIRFSLTKDSIDYLYMKMYKVNDGNLNLPRLYYEIQTNSVPSTQDSTWTLKKTLDDTYFTGESAYTVINGINPNNTVYYRIVVKTDGSEDRIESLKLPYKLSDDTSKPPVPKNVTCVKRELVTDPQYDEKSTNITVAWDKPANWEQLKTGTDEIYFNFLLNIAPKDLNIQPDPILQADGKEYGAYPVKYRFVKAVSAKSPNIDDSGSKLTYTLKGFELFTWEDGNGNPGALPNDENYPGLLLPNKEYYLQMYASSGTYGANPDPSKTSDKSITISFTTLSAVERDIPLPANFIADENSINNDNENYIELQFDKVDINWANYTADHSVSDAVYYDLYMSSRTDGGFTLIGSTENPNGDVSFNGVDDTQSSYIKAQVRSFTDGDLINRFGYGLLPNTTYYFYLKTRLVVENPSDGQQVRGSQQTVILPVTTPSGAVGDPDPSSKRPLAPVDFSIAIDSEGNLMLSGQTVTFNWLKQEDNVTYTLICTSEKVAPNAVPSTYTYDPLYRSFNETFAGSRNIELSLDAEGIPLKDNFEYDKKTKACDYTINKWLFPNRLYYFSLRAESIVMVDGQAVTKVSSWISIPVTTSLIEAPSALEPVNDSQLAFQWVDNSPGMKAEDYRVYVRGPEDKNYKLLTRSQCTVARDIKNGNIYYYTRLLSLKSDTMYSVKVEKPSVSNGVTSYIKVFENTSMKTKDDYHQLEVKWRGLPVDAYSYYEISIKTADEAGYTTLGTADMEQYEDAASGHTYSYYIEKTPQTAGTNYSIFHAKVNSVLVTMPDGTKQHQPLRSNMRYYIKVRAVKIDPADSTLITYSKYIGPVDTRTEFNQDDYDNNDQDTKKEAAFLDKIAKLDQELFWRMGMDSSTYTKLLLKGDRMVNSIRNGKGNTFTLNISDLEPAINVDVIYIPDKVIDALNNENKNLVIKTPGAEFMLRPGTLDLNSQDRSYSVKNQPGAAELFFKMTVSRGEYPVSGMPSGTQRISQVNDLKMQAIGSKKTDTGLNDMFHDKLYNNETGIVKQKLNILLNPYDNDAMLSQEQIDQYINMLVEDVEIELSLYVEDTVEGGSYTAGMIAAQADITSFDVPLQVKLMYNASKGLKSPYVYYDESNAWKKVNGSVVYSNNAATFNVQQTGKYTVLSIAASEDTIPVNHWAKASIEKFMAKYDLNDIFSGIDESFNPDLNVSVKELVLLYEKVHGNTGTNSGMDIKQKAKQLGLDTVISAGNTMKDVSRQETAAAIIKLYCIKQGVDIDSLKPGKNIYIRDEQKIDDKYYKFIVTAIDTGIMAEDGNGDFIPAGPVTRAEMITAFVRMLELTGDL